MHHNLGLLSPPSTSTSRRGTVGAVPTFGAGGTLPGAAGGSTGRKPPRTLGVGECGGIVGGGVTPLGAPASTGLTFVGAMTGGGSPASATVAVGVIGGETGIAPAGLATGFGVMLLRMARSACRTISNGLEGPEALVLPGRSQDGS